MSVAVGFAPNPMMMGAGGGGGPGGSGGGGGGGSGGGFSPLTMFECTISSATMLIDSMAVRDLLVAFKIVAQLHGHLLEVLDPTVLRLVNVADEHAMCPPPPPGFADSRSGGVGPGTSKLEGGKSNSTPGKVSSAAAAAAAAAAVAANASMKSETADSDSDCVLMEADLIFDQSMSTVAKGARHHGAASAGDGGGGDLSNEWKGLLRRAYRVLKDETGSNVFDFSLPYSARANVQAANRVIDKALALGRQRPANVEAWRALIGRYCKIYYYSVLKRDFKLRIQKHGYEKSFQQFVKLNRRQKSYETIKADLDESTRTRYESVLTRDYTSSDEETSADLDTEARVRCLPWESAELRSMKQRLDCVFSERLADDRQRAEMARLQRHPGLRSDRPPPPDCVPWARESGWAGAAAAPGPHGDGCSQGQQPGP